MGTWRRHEYEEADEYGERYAVAGSPGVAWWVLGWEVAPVEVEDRQECWDCDGTGEDGADEDGYPLDCRTCDGTGTVYEYRSELERTGMLLAVMVGDDRPERVDPDDLVPLADEEYCAECGQVGCCADGR